MAKYRIEFKKSAQKEIDRLPEADLKRILERIDALSDSPRPQGCQKLTNKEEYRIRCGQHRIIYSIEDRVLLICVIKVAHRKDAYR
jgi:mRNA interferase RelE/StbE